MSPRQHRVPRAQQPRVVFNELDVENVPGFIEDDIRTEAEREANEKLASIPLDHRYSVTFTEKRGAG
ncbi:MAG TPA: hypothetical protein VMR52_05155 [Dehalococcoidia bacterium]|nr:hypothetical protein [Dehalococcoidia bacterium]